MDGNRLMASLLCAIIFVVSLTEASTTTRLPIAEDTYDGEPALTGPQLMDKNGITDIVIIPLNDGDIQPKSDVTGELKYSLDNNNGRRRKRWVPLAVGLVARGAAAGYRAFKGWRAAQKLRAGAQLSKLNKPSMRVTELNRRGNFRDAIRTFKSLKPKEVKRISGPNGVRGYTGRVGNRRVSVRNKSGKGGRGPPSIEMFRSGASKGNKKIDKVRFHKSSR